MFCSSARDDSRAERKYKERRSCQLCNYANCIPPFPYNVFDYTIIHSSGNCGSRFSRLLGRDVRPQYVVPPRVAVIAIIAERGHQANYHCVSAALNISQIKWLTAVSILLPSVCPSQLNEGLPGKEASRTHTYVLNRPGGSEQRERDLQSFQDFNQHFSRAEIEGRKKMCDRYMIAQVGSEYATRC